MTVYWPAGLAEPAVTSTVPFALRRALIALAALALLMQQLPALPTPRVGTSDAVGPALLAAPSIAERTSSGGVTPPAARTALLGARLADLPVAFEANRGQADPAFDFVARGRGYVFGLTASQIVLALQRGSAASAVGDVLDASGAARGLGTRVLTLELVGARQDAPAAALGELPGKVNYFIGNDPARWRSGIPTYERVRYEGVYPGIDVVHYGNGRQLEFDVVVAPGADPGAFALRVTGAEALSVRGRELVLAVADGELMLRAPEVYQEIDGARVVVGARYVIQGTGLVGIEVDAYDAAKPLVIDPVVAYSTYLGGASADFGDAVAVDLQGNAYVTGFTSSSSFPTTAGAFDATTNGDRDVFVTKLDPTGSAVIWSTYLGGARGDFAQGIAVGGGGIVYVTGWTQSEDLPTTTDAFDRTCGSDGTCNTTVSGSVPDGFVTALHPDGSALTYSTYFGGGGDDRGWDVAVNDAAEAHVTGFTGSSDFPTTAGAFQTTFAGSVADAFVMKLNGIGTALVYSTYLGGSGPPPDDSSTAETRDWGYGIALDPSGNAYVAGITDSVDFPTTLGSYQPAHGSDVNADLPSGFIDGFVTKLSPTGGVAYSTFLGGDRADQARGVAVDPAGNAYVTGGTASFNFPSVNAHDTGYSLGGDAFLTKLNALGSAVLYSTYIGGGAGDLGNGVAADARGGAWVVGYTESTTFPTVAPLQTAHAGGSFDAFVMRFDTTKSGASSLPFSTYFGGAGTEIAIGVALGPDGNPLVAGHTSSNNFPTTSPLQTANAGSFDAFVAKFVDNVLYAVESSSDGLSRIDPITGQATFIARLDPDATKLTTPIAMAVRPSDRTIFVWNNSDGNTNETLVSTGVLLTVDRCTGLATKIDPNTAGQGNLGALAFSPQGTLYGMHGELYTISTTTGVRTLVGSLGGLDIVAADFDPVSGALYGLEIATTTGTGPRLVTINTTTGAATVAASLSQDVGTIGSIAFTSTGALIGSAFNGTPGSVLFDIDKTNGSVSNVRSVTGAFAPQGMGFSGPCDAADLSITKTDGKVVEHVGKILKYTITVQNLGPAVATGVIVTDVLPAGVSFAGASTGCTGTSTVTCSLGTLAAGTSAQAVIFVQPTVAGTVMNTATVSSAASDPVSTNNASTDVTRVFLRPTGSLRAWGWNAFGQLGDGTTTERLTPVRVSAPTTGFIQVVGGSGNPHTLALRSDGTVWAWGDNSLGQLGNGTTTSSSTPLQVSALSEIVAIAASAGSSFALRSDGTVFAWGGNGSGQLGNGTTTNSGTPVELIGLTDVFAIGAGIDHALAVRSDGTAWAWGGNASGQLGNNSTTNSTTPVQVSGLTGVVAVSGGHHHSLALKGDGTVWAWGGNADGQVGDGTTTTQLTPVQVTGLTGATAISAGNQHSLARRSDGTVAAWGDNGAGQLGNGTVTDSSTPVQVSGLSAVDGIAAGGGHSLARKSDGTVFAWGENANGRLGDGTTTVRTTPVQTSGLTGVVAIEAAAAWSLAITAHVTLSAEVRLDIDADGQLDAGEPLTTAASLKIFRVVAGVDTLIAQATNSPNITLTGVEAGTFKIVETNAASFASTNAIGGTLSAIKIDNDTLLVELAPGAIVQGNVFLDRVVGVVVVARCSPTGPALAGVLAQLVQDGVVLATTTTTADGIAIFPGAGAGTFSVILITGSGTQCVVPVTLEGDGDQIVGAPATCTPNNTWLTATTLTADASPTSAALCVGGHLWYRIVMPNGSAIVPQLSRIVARLTGVGGGQLPGDFTLMLVKDPLLALQPVSTPTDAHVQFAGDTFGGDTFGGDTFGGDTFGGDTFGGDTFGGDTFGGDTFGGDTFGGDTFGGDTFGGDTFGGDTFGGDTFGGDTFGGDTFGGDTFGGDTFGGDTFGGVFTLAGGDPRAYAAAISRSVVRVAAHGGTSPEGLWQNTWNNANSWYLRVSSARGSGPFQLSTQVFTGQCGGVDPALGVSSLAVPTTGTYETLILRNSAREGGANAAANLASLQSLAAHATVNGYIADFAGDMAAAYGQLGMNAFCPNAANAVVDGIRGYVRSFKEAHPELKWILIAANDEGVPGYRVPDLSALAPQSMLVLPLQPQMVEGVLRLNYFATDDAYGDWDPVQKLDHLLFIPEVPVGRIDPAYVPTLVNTYIAANGVLTPSTAAVTGYNFWNDSATSIRDQLAATGKPVNQFATTHPLIQAAQGLPTDANAWDVNDLVDAFEADTDIFVLFAHGLRASKIAPANYFPELTASQAIAIGDTSPQIKRLKLLISGACNFALGIPGGQTIPGLTPDPELAEIGQAFGWTTVAWDSYAYGDDERIAYSEELADDLITELRYGTGQVVLGDALVRVKRAWASRQTDLQGIHQKSLMGMVILGMPMLRVDLGSAGRLTRPSDLADFTSAGLAAVPAGTAGSNAALGLRTRDITIDFTALEHQLTKFDVTLANIDTAGSATGASTVTSYWAVTTPTEPQGFVQLNPGEQILPRWSVALHPSDLAGDSATFARGATLVSASCTRTTPFTPLISRAAYQLTPPAGPFVTDRYVPNEWWEINYLDPTREFLLIRPAQYLSAINATTGAPEAFGTSKTFTNVTFRAWYSSLLAQTITDANGAQMQAILAGPPEFLSRTSTPNAEGTAIDFDVRVSVLPNLGVQSVAVLWQDTDPTAPCELNSLELTQDPTNGQRWTRTLTLPAGVNAADVTYALQAVSGAGRVRVADNFGLWYAAHAGPTLPAPLADTALAFLSAPASAVSGRTVTVSAELRRTDTNTTVSGRRLLFRLSGVGGDRAFGYTNASGVAQATLDVDVLPGALSVWVEFEGSDGLRGSSRSSALTVQKETAAFSLLTVTPSTQQDTDVVQVSARLADGLGRRLREQGVLFLVTSAACAAYLSTDPACAVVQAQGAETDFRGDARASFALATGAGALRIHALFGGTALVPSGLASPVTITLDLQNARYQPATAGTPLTVTAEDVTVGYTGDTVKAMGQPISLGGTLTEAADGSLGTITTGGTLATFEISDTNGALVATVFGTITPTGPGTANVSGTLPTGLGTGVYSIVLGASGDRSGQSAVVFLAVYDPTAGFVTGGGWLDPDDDTVVGFDPSGKLSFGFSFKYRNGAPVGDLQAQQQGGISVKGASADWLVIVGSTAEFEGPASVNGVGGFRYRMSVTDGPDGARLRVWDAATGSVSSPLYDAQRTPIDKGSIVIHQ